MNQSWQQIGHQRDWVWRGWQTRYTYSRPANLNSQQSPVMFLHGFGGSIGHWRHNWTEIAAQNAVYAIDLVGFGASRKPQTEYQINLWVEQLHDFWQTFVRVPMVIVGNSIGSLVALVAAATYPEMVKSLVMVSLFDPSAEQELIPGWLLPVANWLKLAVVPRFLLKRLFYVVRQPWLAKRWAKFAYANDGAIDRELMDIFLTPAQEAEAADAFAAILRGIISIYFSPNVRRFLPKMKVPMLLIWGHSDRIIPRSNVENLVRLNPNLQFVEIKGAGHCAHDETPIAVNKLINDWLAKHQPPSLAAASAMPVQLYDKQKSTHSE
jgi:pimeloyl-ACP methyl ester carboxylesterase